MGWAGLLSLLVVLAAWGRGGWLLGVVAILTVGLIWALWIFAAFVLDERRKAKTAAVEAAIEDQAARRWAREELLRKDVPAKRS